MTPAFDSVIGHENAKAFLAGVQTTGRIASGFLLHGDSGRGKFLLARAFIQRLFCANQDGCGQCPPCARYAAGSHGDIEVVALAEGKSRISIEQLRDLREWFHRAPYEADRRCAIIDDAHLMTEEAQNSLLKLLEEPPARGVIILVAPNPQSLLDTIHSRLQSVYCGPLETAVVEEYLRREVDASEEDIRRAAVLANGSIGRGLDLVGDEHAELLREAALRLFDLKTLPFSYAELVSGGRSSGAELRHRVLSILEVAMDLTSQQLAACAAGHAAPSPVPAMSGWHIDVLAEIQRILLDAADSVRSNVAPRGVMESLKIRLHRVIGQARRQGTVGGGR